MGSRIRENVKHLFQCFCEVVQPQPPDKEAWIIQKFPESYNEEEVLKSVPKFSYPCEFKKTVIEHYSFVLTSIDSKWTFGFCRHDPKTETALVLLSFLPWHESFYKLLDIIGEMVISSKAGAEQLWTFLDAVYNSTVPEQGSRLQVPYNFGLSNFTCIAPNQYSLPSIPENRNLMEYYSAVDSSNMMIIFASMLYERRIIFTSTRLCRLSACVQAANAIIYPMNWQHIFIPVLPVALIDYLLAPMPFLIGVPTSTLKRVHKADIGEVVILDADSNTVDSPFNDLDSLPLDVVNSLKRQLRNQMALGDGVSRAFLRALVQLIGGYRDALRFHQGERITFNADAFVESRPASMQPFLRKMLQLQIFQQFIDERLDMLNAGLGFSDEFELEACNYSDKSSSKLKQQYKEWMSTMRKEGTAFFKSVKSKANPAVKSAVKSVKDRGKDVRQAYKGIRSKFRELQPPSREYAGATERESTSLKDRPTSAPSSPVQKRRPNTFTAFSKLSPTATVSYRKDPAFSADRETANQENKNFSSLLPGEASGISSSISGCNSPGVQLSPIDTDLMGDLHEMIFRKTSFIPENSDVRSVSPKYNNLPPVDRTLKPGRSFDGFGGRAFIGSANSCQQSSPLGPFVASPSYSTAPFSPPPLMSFDQSAVPNSNAFSPSKIFNQQIISLNAPSNTFTSKPGEVFSSGNFEPKGASYSSSFPVALPPPSAASPARVSRENKEPSNSNDLIRLDSTPSYEDFDPLMSNTPMFQEIAPSVNSGGNKNNNNNNVINQNSGLSMEVGLSNPLYPYFEPQHNNSFLYSQASVGAMSQSRAMSTTEYSASPAIDPVSSVNVNQSGFDRQDSDLLKEYGLDFKSLSLRSFNNPVVKPIVTDPFEEVERLAKDSQLPTLQQTQPGRTTWTTFE